MPMKCQSLIVALTMFAVTPVLASGPSFRPDITETGKNLNNWHTLGQAEWHAENGEIVGTPGASGGGWLVFNKSYQDINFYTQFRCTRRLCHRLADARGEDAGRRHERCLFLSQRLHQQHGEYGWYDVTLDAQGKIVTATAEPARQRLRPHHFAVASQAAGPRPRTSRPSGRGSQEQAARRPAALHPFHDSTIATGRMTGITCRIHFDANTLPRVSLNGGGGRISLAAEGYGPIALYVGGTGKVEFKDLAVGDLGLQVREPEVDLT